MKVRLTVELPVELYGALKQHAERTGESMMSVIRAALRRCLDEENRHG